MKLFNSFIMFILVFCLMGAFAKLSAQQFDFDFSVHHQEWQGDFTDYPVGQEIFFELAWGWRDLPTELWVNDQRFTKGLFLSGNNHSDDLFMFIKRKVSGLKPRTFYDLTFEVIIQSNIPSGTMGIGGSPGESVYFKVGASHKKPEKRNINGDYRLNVDKGEQSQGGRNALVVGNLANPAVDQENPTYEPLSYTNVIPLRTQTDQQGGLWLFAGTDSGFEGTTSYYIAYLSVLAEESSP